MASLFKTWNGRDSSWGAVGIPGDGTFCSRDSRPETGIWHAGGRDPNTLSVSSAKKQPHFLWSERGLVQGQ